MWVPQHGRVCACTCNSSDSHLRAQEDTDKQPSAPQVRNKYFIRADLPCPVIKSPQQPRERSRDRDSGSVTKQLPTPQQYSHFWALEANPGFISMALEHSHLAALKSFHVISFKLSNASGTAC